MIESECNYAETAGSALLSAYACSFEVFDLYSDFYYVEEYGRAASWRIGVAREFQRHVLIVSCWSKNFSVGALLLILLVKH